MLRGGDTFLESVSQLLLFLASLFQLQPSAAALTCVPVYRRQCFGTKEGVEAIYSLTVVNQAADVAHTQLSSRSAHADKKTGSEWGEVRFVSGEKLPNQPSYLAGDCLVVRTHIAML